MVGKIEEKRFDKYQNIVQGYSRSQGQVSGRKIEKTYFSYWPAGASHFSKKRAFKIEGRVSRRS
jgi:hypothetical protein